MFTKIDLQTYQRWVAPLHHVPLSELPIQITPQEAVANNTETSKVEATSNVAGQALPFYRQQQA